MKEVGEALVKVQVALENDAEAYLSQIEQVESVCDRVGKSYTGMLNVTDEAEQHAESYAAAKQRFRDLLAQLERVDAVVAKHEQLAAEIQAWTKELTARLSRTD